MCLLIKKKVQLKGNFAGSQIHYTLDGSEPTINSPLYKSPLEVSKAGTLKAKEFLNGKSVGKTFTAEFLKEAPQKAVEVKNVKNGIAFKYFLLPQGIDSSKQLLEFEPNSSGVLDGFKFPSDNTPEYFGMIFNGYLKIPETGVYSINITSNDGTKLYLNNKLLVDNDGLHGPEMRKEQIALEKGFFPVKLYYFQAGGGKKLEVRWSGPGIDNEIIDGKYLYTNQ